MAADPGETIATALASYLTTESASMVLSFTATAPEQVTLERESAGLAVQVVPSDASHGKITRDGKTLDRYGIRVLVTNALEGTVTRSQMSQLMNEIRQSIKGTAQSGYPQSTLETEVNYDVEHLQAKNQFTAVLRAEYLGAS